jgi:hypothetical protein
MIKLAPYWDGFGDLWAITSYSCLLSQRVEHPVHLSKWSVKSMWDRETEIRDILGNLDDGYAENVMVTAERFSTNSRFSVAYHHEPYVPTKVKWARNDGRIISYQVETSTTHRPDRFCDPWFIDDLRDRLPDYDFVALGKHHQSTIGEIIDILSKSELFVGIDSGMSHVAHSVGVPVFLKHYAELEGTHPNKEYAAFQDGADLTRKLSEASCLSRPMSANAGGRSTTWRRSRLSHVYRGIRRRCARSVRQSLG